MAQSDAAKRRTRRAPKRTATSTVRELMLAKLGPRGYGRLLEQLRGQVSE